MISRHPVTLILTGFVINQEPIPIEKSHNSRLSIRWAPETTRLQAWWSLGPTGCQVGNYAISQQACIPAIPDWVVWPDNHLKALRTYNNYINIAIRKFT